eukprot:m.306824 g.306824  ORF g.306824 m.306824 type:complete len:630 (+) comp41610_c0_seq1:118-2007(+)
MTSNSTTTSNANASSKSAQKRHQKNDPKAKQIHCSTEMLDGEVFECDLDRDTKSPVLVDMVFDQLNVLEKDYFGVYFIDAEGDRNWLDPRKMLRKQVRDKNYSFFFAVKFYATDPNTLHEDITRYQVCLQVKKDVLTGALKVSQETASLLASYSIQAELGDYDPAVHNDDYLSGYEFIPNQPADFLAKVKLQHKEHLGQTPADAENHFLEHTKRLEGFGVVRHEAKDHDNLLISLGVSGHGIDVLRDERRINRFSWPKVMKLAFRRKKFSIKIRPSENDEHETTVSFRFDGSKKAKLMWKISVMHHVFFRMSMAIAPPKRTGFLKMGSKFRYSGKTLRQLKSMEMQRQQPQFERKPSKRLSKGGEARDGKEKEKDESDRPQSLSYAPGYVPSPQAKHFVEQQKSPSAHSGEPSPGEANFVPPAPVVEPSDKEEDSKERGEAPPKLLAMAADESEAQPGGKDDLDPDYQELAEDGSQPTSPKDSEGVKVSASAAFDAYKVPEVGLEVEIQSALASSPSHQPKPQTTSNGGTVTVRTGSLAEESLTVDNPGTGPPADVFVPQGQPQALDQMLASLENSGATITEVRVITKTVKVDSHGDGEIRIQQAELMNIADELDALASDLNAGKEASS